MHTYYVDGFENQQQYHMFIGYLLAFSDAFSLIYFRYKENERPKRKVKSIKKMLAPYKIYSRRTNRWPGTDTLNEFNHIYDLNVYRTDMGAMPALEMATSIWDWDYPQFPMDLCFYRQGCAWFAMSAHELWNRLYCDDPAICLDLESIGILLMPCDDIDELQLYYDPKTVIPGRQNE